MTNLFVSLLFLSVILLLVGLIKPASVIRWGENRSRKRVVLLFGAIIITLLMLIGATAEPRPRTISSEQTTPQTTTTQTPELLSTSSPTPAPTSTPEPTTKPKEPSYSERLPRFISFLCSKPEDEHAAYYYFINSFTTNKSFPLPEKITDVTVHISTRTNKGGWDTNFLCSSESAFDLPAHQWKVLIPGKDCGVGAALDPCDIDFVSDVSGVSAIIIGPELNGYTSGVTGKYVVRGALLKVTGKLVK